MDQPADVPTKRLGANYRRLIAATGISNLGDGIGLVAYPWLASAATRNPLLISLVVVAQRLPWLLFTLPAGVVADRYDRGRIMVLANLARAVLTGVIAMAVMIRQDSLPSPDELESAQALAQGTDVPLYVALLIAIALIGIGEVLFDNANQTYLPHLVHESQLEKANGRLWSVEMIANSIVGPPLGAWLLVGMFALPFLVDAVTFAVAAALIAAIAPSVTSSKTASATTETGAEADNTETGADETAQAGWWDDIKEGFGWLWRHDFLRPLAIILGLMNMASNMGTASLVLFAQEELRTSPGEFAFIGIGGAVGGIVGGWTGSWVAKKLGSGPSLWLALVGGGLTNIVIGLTSSWLVVAAMFGIFMPLAVLWNVITVSLRQTIIPDRLLGRVNSVYRFFAWGMIPIGALLGGLLIALFEAMFDRGVGLRSPWIVSGLFQVAMIVWAGPKLTTARIEAAKAPADG
jgi:MFS family permease